MRCSKNFKDKNILSDIGTILQSDKDSLKSAMNLKPVERKRELLSGEDIRKEWQDKTNSTEKNHRN